MYNKLAVNSSLSSPRDLVPPINTQQIQQLVTQLQAYKIRVMQLEEQLSLTRHNFQGQVNQMTLKYSQKSQLFMSLMKQMQERHYKQVNSYQVQLSNYQMDKIKMGNLEHKMSQIGIGIEDIVQQSKLLSKANQEMQRKILQKDRIIQKLALQVQKLNQQLQQYQNKMESYQKSKLKFIKRNKDIAEFILQAELSISSLTPNQDNVRASVLLCASTGHKSSQCNHCKLASLEKKYSKLLN